MVTSRFVVGAALVTLSLSGCANFGRSQKDHQIDPDPVAEIKKGMSKEDVTKRLGAPKKIIFSNKEHDPIREHAYVFEQSTTVYTALFFGVVNFGNQDTKRDRVIVFFDEAGKVDHVAQSLKADQAAYGFPFGR
jgi:outer membrane protein assembly factor BamE (lipoprotein component of BamABCDE complex)